MRPVTIGTTALQVQAHLVYEDGSDVDLATASAVLWVSGGAGRAQRLFSLVTDGTDGRVSFGLSDNDLNTVRRVTWQFMVTLPTGEVVWTPSDGFVLQYPAGLTGPPLRG